MPHGQKTTTSCSCQDRDHNELTEYQSNALTANKYLKQKKIRENYLLIYVLF